MPPAKKTTTKQTGPTIAFTLIGHDEATNLPRALASVAWADEVIYVDCESTDGSAAVAAKHTKRVYSRPNNANLNVNKTYGIEQATSDWVFYLDPDEEISPELAAEIRAVIAADPPENAFKLPRKNIFFGTWLRHGGQFPDTQLRLFRRGKAHFPCKHVHERLEVQGETGSLHQPMAHYTNATPLDALKKMEFYSLFNARVLAEQGRPPGPGMAFRYLCWLPFTRFVRRYVFKRGCLDGWAGLFVALIDSLENQLRFIKYWTLYHQRDLLPPEVVTGESTAVKSTAKSTAKSNTKSTAVKSTAVKSSAVKSSGKKPATGKGASRGKGGSA